MTTGDAALSVSWRRAGRTRAILLGCAALLLIAFVGSLAIGPVVIAPEKVVSILWNGLFGVRGSSSIDLRDAILSLIHI